LVNQALQWATDIKTAKIMIKKLVPVEMKNQNFFQAFIILFIMSVAASCKKDKEVIPETPPSMVQLYQNAILDAMVADSSEVVDTLWAISSNNSSLQWKTINGKNYVLLASFMRYPSSYPVGDSITNTWGESWVFIPQQMKARIGSSFSSESDTTMRICQLLGLPPANETSNTHIAEIWVSPDDLYRPAGNPSITPTSSGASLLDNVSTSYGEWFNNYIIFAYYRSLSGDSAYHYPWTRLGYTYDWNPESKEVGLSEYVVRPNTGIWVEKVAQVSSYF